MARATLYARVPRIARITGVTVIHLLRHGEHAMAGRILPGRMPGVGLSERGRTDVAAVAERLAGDGVAALYSSPLQRTQETAEIVAARLGLPVALREALIELDFGEWTGQTFDAIRADPRWEPWRLHRGISTIPGGESMRQVQHRVVEALMELRRDHPDDTVVAVSHGDVIRSALLFALGMPLDSYTRLEVVQGSISTICIDRAGIRVTAVNERPHPGSG